MRRRRRIVAATAICVGVAIAAWRWFGDSRFRLPARLVTEDVVADLSAAFDRDAVVAEPAADPVRRANSSLQPGMSSPAGDHYSTVGDFLKLANALTSGRLLDAAHTAAVLGARYASGDDFRANGGGPGVNAELSIYPSGDVMVVLSNYDPPGATVVAQYIRSLLASNAAPIR